MPDIPPAENLITYNSRGGLVDSKTKSNPFEDTRVNSYSFRPTTVPPYVLDTLSPAHYKEQLNNSNLNKIDESTHLKSNAPKISDDEQYLSFANDIYVNSMHNNWTNFLNSVKQPKLYLDEQLKVDKQVDKEWDLSGAWGGEERLRVALLGSRSSDEIENAGEERGIFQRIFPMFEKKKYNPDTPKVRSKAGYWMSDEKRADLFPTLKRIFVQNPLVPLFLRILIIIFSACALSLAAVIFVYSRRKYDGVYIQQQPSTIMAIVVQCFAIVYVIYIAYDEYSGKPLGLRDPLGKMKLIMLDLLFIIFSSANLSLTFNTLYDDEWVCRDDIVKGLDELYPSVGSICRRQRSLAAFLFLSLCLWLITFTISIVRVIDRVKVVNPRND